MDLGDKFRQRRGTEMNTVSAGKKTLRIDQKIKQPISKESYAALCRGEWQGECKLHDITEGHSQHFNKS